MIQQEIKLYDEPVQKPQQQHSSMYGCYTGKEVTQEILDKQIDLAKKLGLKVGARFQYKYSKVGFRLKAFLESPKECSLYKQEPAFIVGIREDLGPIRETYFTIGEFEAGTLEVINENL